MSSSSPSWSCKKCTFLNSPSQKSHCEVCLTLVSPPPSPSSSSSSSSRWPCQACTFLNPLKNSACEICGGTRSRVGSLSVFKDLTDTGLDCELDGSVGSVFFPLRRCKRKASDEAVVLSDDEGSCSESLGFRETKASDKEIAKNEVGDPIATSISLKIMSYNVWFREDLELHQRMKAIGNLVQQHSPDLICFQEVTPNIYDIFRRSNWWKTYQPSITSEVADSRPYFCMQLSKLPVKSFRCSAFSNSIMGRELCIAEVEVASHPSLVFATSHLESPCPAPPRWDQMFSKERVDQAKEALRILKTNPNVIFGGDMNWDDKLDGEFPLPDGWVDAWTESKPGENGFTYDTKSNQMLSGNRALQKRLDRFLCCLKDYKISEIEMLGKDVITGLSYVKEKKVKNQMKKLELPVLPSDHYGLLLTISSR